MATDWDMESAHRDVWRSRITDCIKVIMDMDADIVCLQEYWFDSTFRDMFEDKKSVVAAKYSIFAFQRTGRKPDGMESHHIIREPLLGILVVGI
jgi:endonuclease/exonuclease/phosphatase family metal-dependent hydrolase